MDALTFNGIFLKNVKENGQETFHQINMRFLSLNEHFSSNVKKQFSEDD